LIIAFAQPTGYPVHARQAGNPHQFLGQVLEDVAFFSRFVIFALYLQHGRSHQPRLRVTRIGAQHRRQICQGGIELVHALPHCSTQDQHFLGRVLEMPPRGQRGLRIAGVMRIAGDATHLEVALRDADRQRQIIGLAGQLTVECVQVAHGGIARRERQAFEDLAVGLRDKRCSRRPRRRCGDEDNANQHTKR
jgi:hypothetical protein